MITSGPLPVRSIDLPLLAVALTDPDEARRVELRAALRVGGIDVVREEACPAHLPAGGPDAFGIAVLSDDDLGPPELEKIERIRGAASCLRVVAVAPSPGERAVREAFEAGVEGVVATERAGETLALAVRAAHSGQLSLPADWRRPLGKPVLSARQKQALAMVVLGFSNARIARAMNVAESTVKSHLTSAFTKLGVRSRYEAAALILDPESGLGPGILTISGDGKRKGGDDEPASEHTRRG